MWPLSLKSRTVHPEGSTPSPLIAQESTGLKGSYFGQIPPGDTPVLFAPELLRDPGEYHSPVVFSPDGTEAYWTPAPGHGQRNTTLISRMVDGVWTSQGYVDFGLEAPATEVAFSPDGGTILFLSRQMLEGERSLYPPEDAPERIWHATRSLDGIGQPQLISEVITAHRTHWQFSASASGDLYSTSHNPEVSGGGDVYVAEFDGTTYLEPRPLGPEINSDIRDSCPFIAPDEFYLIFTRGDRSIPYSSDLFVSYRRSDGSWTGAERLPSPINSDTTDLYPVVTPDGEYLFFLAIGRGQAGSSGLTRNFFAGKSGRPMEGHFARTSEVGSGC